MERFFDKNLNELRVHLNQMAELAVTNINNAVHALIERDLELARATLKADDEIDELNKWIDQHVVEHISLCSPVASDVRLLYTTIKGSRDLERAGDEASTIAKRAKKIIRSGYPGDFYDIPKLARLATNLVEESLQCFLKGDLETAGEIPKKDKEIDELYKAIDKKINLKISQNDFRPEDAPSLIDLLFISKSLERVGDHAVNIAKEVIYFLTGEDIRYTGKAKRS